MRAMLVIRPQVNPLPVRKMRVSCRNLRRQTTLPRSPPELIS